MKRPAYDKEALRENKGGMQVGQPSADPQQTQETTRTQITPDDICLLYTSDAADE